MHSITRTLAFLVGTGILAAVAHVTILSTGDYAQPMAAMVIALACGVAIGAVAIGQALSHGRRTLAGLLVLALLAGEGFGLLRTADMLVTASEARQAPVRDAIARRTAAEARLAAAEASDAVRRAELAKAEIDAKAMATSAEKTCGSNCRRVLDAQVSAAALAVGAARTGAEAEIAAARAELGRNPMPASANPLADRLGLPAWALDLILAGLGSIGCNGLAACLLAFAAHGPRLGPAIKAPNLGPATAPMEPHNMAAQQPRLGRSVLDLPAVEVIEPGDIDAFMLERVQVTRGGRISWARLFTEYVAWCRASDVEPASVSVFGQRMDALRHELGRDVREDRGQVYFIGLGLKRLQLAAT
ncbi:hypothetical protein [Hyphomicrobium sulfonivorans]|uniref:hypothetical protein n=1 Tax=Hyphomicrobium sulfonivorans TaxID=121290 RepID=UPI00156ECBEC|nr:hypothetical protein [Hyphomicrobium sulfonivorans]MBI1651153.1 hypothetical protein [Hyphomicrobium sulfonivorans]NSL72463.1 hypothetical protein [Hyphomicrobium sulfonivorans]